MNKLGMPMKGAMEVDGEALAYAGFWVRVLASLVDTVLLLLLVTPLLLVIYGPDALQLDAQPSGVLYALINYVLPAVAVITFWVYKSATPGKMLFRLAIVDAKTGLGPSKGQLIGRYFAYYVSMIPLFLGFIWVGFDKRKQGFHDKLARTVVIRRGRMENPRAKPDAGPASGVREPNEKRHIQPVERMR